MEQTFYEMVYDVVRLIPKGRVTSYGAIARCLGAGGSARMVGYAMNNAHGMHPPVPAHRVVNRNGYLTGKFHFNPPELMQQLLENEGITVIDDKIQHFKDHNWDPAVEI
jgi:methylated-DNA-protein-cysteine methyltransferase-like protein